VIAYARAGDLKSVKAWIDSGGPLNLPPAKKTKRHSPLQIAIDKGFLTLVEMLLDGGADPEADDALDGRSTAGARTSPDCSWTGGPRSARSV
jgi:ankyrin repeat protein